MSPLLFDTYSEKILEETNTTVFVDSSQGLREIVNSLVETSEDYGFGINKDNNQDMTISRNRPT